jgi:hypothetical protein
MILDFRNDFSEKIANFLRTITIKNQFSSLDQSDYYWPGELEPVLKSQTDICNKNLNQIFTTCYILWRYTLMFL